MYKLAHIILFRSDNCTSITFAELTKDWPNYDKERRLKVINLYSIRPCSTLQCHTGTASTELCHSPSHTHLSKPSLPLVYLDSLCMIYRYMLYIIRCKWQGWMNHTRNHRHLIVVTVISSMCIKKPADLSSSLLILPVPGIALYITGFYGYPLRSTVTTVTQ